MTVTRKHYPTPEQLAQWQRIDAVDTPIAWGQIADIELRLPALLDYCATHCADRELLVFDDQRITYGAAIAQSALLARQLLAAGIGKGARVGMLFPNSPQFVVSGWRSPASGQWRCRSARCPRRQKFAAPRFTPICS